MDAAVNRAPPGHRFRPVADAMVWSPLILLAVLPVLRARWSMIDSTVAAKGVVGLLEVAFVAAVLWQYSARAPRIGRCAGTLLALWFSWATLAVIQSDHVAAALVRHAEWVAHGLFAYALYILLRVNAEYARHLIRLLAAGALLFFAEFLLFRITLPEAGVGLQYEIPGFGNIRHLGHYAMVIALLPMTLALRVERTPGPPQTDRLLAAAALTAGWCLVFWTGGRGPLLAILLGSVVLARDMRAPSVRPYLAWLTGTAALGYALAALLSVPGLGVGRFGARLFGSLDSVALYSSGRLPVWVDALAASVKSPLFGLGPDGYLFLPQAGESFMHPHAFPLQSALEWGVPGAAFAAALIVLFALRNVQMSAGAVPAAWALLSLLALSLIDGTLYFPYPLMFAAACAAVIAAGNAAKPQAPKPVGGAIPALATVACAAILSVHMASVTLALTIPADAGKPPGLLLAFPSGMADPRAPGRLWRRLAACDVRGGPDCVALADAGARHVRPPLCQFFRDAAQRMASGEPDMQAYFRKRAPRLHTHDASPQKPDRCRSDSLE